jgi:hypothetical protein
MRLRERNLYDTSSASPVNLEAEVVAVGHGDPITGGAAERLRSLV